MSILSWLLGTSSDKEKKEQQRLHEDAKTIREVISKKRFERIENIGIKYNMSEEDRMHIWCLEMDYQMAHDINPMIEYGDDTNFLNWYNARR